MTECPAPWCVLPAGHRPVHDVLSVPRQVHSGSWSLRAHFLEQAARQEEEEAA